MADEPKWTPGPWRYTKAAPSGDRGIYADGTGIFAEAFADIRRAGENNATEAEANAHLIAAAPDMAEALKAVADHFGPFAGITINGKHDPEDVRVIDMVQAALGKARGAA